MGIEITLEDLYTLLENRLSSIETRLIGLERLVVPLVCINTTSMTNAYVDVPNLNKQISVYSLPSDPSIDQDIGYFDTISEAIKTADELMMDKTYRMEITVPPGLFKAILQSLESLENERRWVEKVIKLTPSIQSLSYICSRTLDRKDVFDKTKL